LTDPYLLFRSIIPPLGGIDISILTILCFRSRVVLSVGCQRLFSGQETSTPLLFLPAITAGLDAKTSCLGCFSFGVWADWQDRILSSLLYAWWYFCRAETGAVLQVVVGIVNA